MSARGQHQILFSYGGSSQFPWTQRTPTHTCGFYGVAYSAALDRWVVTGSCTDFMYSADGITWTATTPAAGGGFNWRPCAYGVIGGSPHFVCGSWFGSANNALHSSDGITWTLGSLGIGAITRICFSSDLERFVGVGDDVFCYSDDGVTWTAPPDPPGAGFPDSLFEGVAWGNGIFVAVASAMGTAGYDVATSADGETWTGGNMPGSREWRQVQFGGGQFVAIAADTGAGNTSAIATSPDGVTWTSRTTPSLSGGGWNSLAYGNGIWVALANSASGFDTAMYSLDAGVTWTIEQSDIDSVSWWDIAYGDGRFVAVGSNNGPNNLMSKDRPL